MPFKIHDFPRADLWVQALFIGECSHKVHAILFRDSVQVSSTASLDYSSASLAFLLSEVWIESLEVSAMAIICILWCKPLNRLLISFVHYSLADLLDVPSFILMGHLVMESWSCSVSSVPCWHICDESGIPGSVRSLDILMLVDMKGLVAWFCHGWDWVDCILWYSHF